MNPMSLLYLSPENLQRLDRQTREPHGPAHTSVPWRERRVAGAVCGFALLAGAVLALLPALPFWS